tara:strand:- start:1786 stop:2085 length:300 start_codon:yes stop_codon:yes gene_type:complete
MSEPQTAPEPVTTEAAGEPVGDAVATPVVAKVPEEVKQVAIPDYDDEDAEDSLFGEFLLFLKEEKKWWLAPLVILLVGLGALVAFTEGSALAPFIYTVF